MSTTSIPGWPYDESPFHRGELAVQERVGVRRQLDGQARRGIRNYLPEQHRRFFAQLPFIVVGSADARGQPWASVVAGPTGFVTAPTEHELTVRAPLLDADPLRENLKLGAPVGLLGIEPHTRRRNRMNGTVTSVAAGGFSVRVDLSFGNCPKYVQAREPIFVDGAPAREAGRGIHRREGLDEAMQQLLASADTFFIATACLADETDGGTHSRQHGVDVSHRGGKPGFVRIDDALTLTVPDFVGNFFFNTIGNLQMDPRAGLLFIDFSRGDLLYLAVEAEIIWDGETVRAFAGAERLLRFRIKEALHVEGSLPLRWGAATPSPFLERMGAWA